MTEKDGRLPEPLRDVMKNTVPDPAGVGFIPTHLPVLNVLGSHRHPHGQKQLDTPTASTGPVPLAPTLEGVALSVSFRV